MTDKISLLGFGERVAMKISEHSSGVITTRAPLLNCQVLLMGHWEIYLTSLFLSFLICKMETIIMFIFCCHCENKMNSHIVLLIYYFIISIPTSLTLNLTPLSLIPTTFDFTVIYNVLFLKSITVPYI